MKELVISLAKKLSPGKENIIKEYSIKEIKKIYPEYLNYEPLWNEYQIHVSSHNIFNNLNIKTLKFGTSEDISKTKFKDKLREEELTRLINP